MLKLNYIDVLAVLELIHIISILIVMKLMMAHILGISQAALHPHHIIIKLELKIILTL